MKFILNNRIAKWFFHKYFNIPKDKEVFKLQKTAIHYWEKKGQAKCHQYQKPIWDIPIIKKLKYACIIGLAFLKNPVGFIFIGLTDTDSTNSKDSFMVGPFGNAEDDVNFGSNAILATRDRDTAIARVLIHFALSSGSGTISDVKLYLYYYEHTDTPSSPDVTTNVHELLQTAWTESGVTWNCAVDDNNDGDCDTEWGGLGAGGDYDTDIVDTIEVTLATYTWYNWVLMGTGASNALTLTWEDDVHLLLKKEDETQGVGDQYAQLYYSKESAEDEKPYLEITYTTAQDYTMTVTVGTFALTGISVLLTKALNIACAVGTFVLTGINVALSRGYTIVASVGEFTLTGIAVIFTKALNIVCSVGEFTLTGIAVALTRGYTIVMSAGSFILTGIDIIFRGWWKRMTKHSADWTQETKHTTDWTQENKHSADWVNKTKH